MLRAKGGDVVFVAWKRVDSFSVYLCLPIIVRVFSFLPLLLLLETALLFASTQDDRKSE